MLGKAHTLLLAASVQLLAQHFSLEPLAGEASRNIAPSAIQKAMKGFEKSDFSDCTKQLKLSRADQQHYFSAIPISIGAPGQTFFLVYPSKYCFAFYGAHAIAYWILHRDETGRLKLLYSGRSDGFDVLETQSNGLKDLRSAYGSTFIILKYDGHSYKKVSDGKFPDNQ